MSVTTVGAFRLHTRNLTAGQSLTLVGTDGVLYASYQMSGATGDNGTVEGNLDFRASSDSVAVASEPVAIPANGGNVFASPDTQKGLEFTIACVQGTLKIILGF